METATFTTKTKTLKYCPETKNISTVLNTNENKVPWSISKAVAAQGGAGRSDTNIDAINYTAVLDLLLHQSAAILFICGRHSHLQKQAMFPVSKRPSSHRYFVLISCVLLLLLLQLSRKWTLLLFIISMWVHKWRRSWIQHGRLRWKSTKSTASLWPRTQRIWFHDDALYKSTFYLLTYTLATKSTATSCRIHVVADLLPKPATKLNVSTAVDFVAGFGNKVDFQQSRLCWIQLSRQCVLGFRYALRFVFVAIKPR